MWTSTWRISISKVIPAIQVSGDSPDLSTSRTGGRHFLLPGSSEALHRPVSSAQFDFDVVLPKGGTPVVGGFMAVNLTQLKNHLTWWTGTQVIHEESTVFLCAAGWENQRGGCYTWVYSRVSWRNGRMGSVPIETQDRQRVNDGQMTSRSCYIKCGRVKACGASIFEYLHIF